jgi:hypothetical protein
MKSRKRFISAFLIIPLVLLFMLNSEAQNDEKNIKVGKKVVQKLFKKYPVKATKK